MFESKEFVAYFLNVAAEAEDSDGGVFDRICEAVPRSLRDDIKRHADDEKRHAAILRRCVERNGGAPGTVDPSLQLFNRLLEAAGISEPAAQLMEFFLLLETAEERAAKQYTAIAGALADIDPESAEALLGIARDEAQHVAHCHKLARFFAPDEGALEAALGALREVEARVFSAFAAAVFEGATCQQ